MTACFFRYVSAVTTAEGLKLAEPFEAEAERTTSICRRRMGADWEQKSSITGMDRSDLINLGSVPIVELDQDAPSSLLPSGPIVSAFRSREVSALLARGSSTYACAP